MQPIKTIDIPARRGSDGVAIRIISPAGGILDYANELGRALLDRYPGSDMSVTSSNGRTLEAVDEPRGRRVILVQYCGYGFQRRGAPLWLLKWIAHRKMQGDGIGCFFHELYAFGPPWRSSFWLSPVQRYIAAELARLCDFWMTNREASATWLREAAGDKPHAVLPVLSSVGETLDFRIERSPRIVLFGSAGSRQAAYAAAGRRLFEVAAEWGMEIHDVGPALDKRVARRLVLAGLVEHGYLAVDEIRTLFKHATFGVIAYPASYLGKSSIFAAYCAYGICPIVYSNDYYLSDQLQPAVHYLTASALNSSLPVRASAIGEAAWHWYQTHRVQCHAEAVLQLSDLLL